MEKTKPPVVEIESIYLDENYYECDGTGRRWYAPDLIRASEGLPIFDLPMAGIRLDQLKFGIDDAMDFVHHMKRIMECDLRCPIILDDQGIICDGVHRVHKALYLGHSTIKARRLMKMPPASVIAKTE